MRAISTFLLFVAISFLSTGGVSVWATTTQDPLDHRYSIRCNQFLSKIFGANYLNKKPASPNESILDSVAAGLGTPQNEITPKNEEADKVQLPWTAPANSDDPAPHFQSQSISAKIDPTAMTTQKEGPVFSNNDGVSSMLKAFQTIKKNPRAVFQRLPMELKTYRKKKIVMGATALLLAGAFFGLKMSEPAQLEFFSRLSEEAKEKVIANILIRDPVLEEKNQELETAKIELDTNEDLIEEIKKNAIPEPSIDIETRRAQFKAAYEKTAQKIAAIQSAIAGRLQKMVSAEKNSTDIYEQDPVIESKAVELLKAENRAEQNEKEITTIEQKSNPTKTEIDRKAQLQNALENLKKEMAKMKSAIALRMEQIDLRQQQQQKELEPSSPLQPSPTNPTTEENTHLTSPTIVPSPIVTEVEKTAPTDLEKKPILNRQYRDFHLVQYENLIQEADLSYVFDEKLYVLAKFKIPNSTDNVWIIVAKETELKPKYIDEKRADYFLPKGGSTTQLPEKIEKLLAHLRQSQGSREQEFLSAVTEKSAAVPASYWIVREKGSLLIR